MQDVHMIHGAELGVLTMLGVYKALPLYTSGHVNLQQQASPQMEQHLAWPGM
jgi:hypothetical protein